MARTEAHLSNLITLRPQFLRSAHLERDFFTRGVDDGYIMTRGSLSALSLLARGTKDPSYRALSISGPYGSGKSALALYFASILNKDGAFSDKLRSKARPKLGDISKDLLPDNGQGYVPILATGSREDLASCLIKSLTSSLQKAGRDDLLKKLSNAAKPRGSANSSTSRDIVSTFEDLSQLAVNSGALGVIIILDELGKLLEHAALHPEENDLGILQELAEAASRSHDYPLWFITILHQDLSQYASRLGRNHQREWFKVQQRFYDVPCSFDDADALQLVAEALNSSSSQTLRRNPLIEEVARTCAQIAPRGAIPNFEKWCVSSYPLHPTSLVLLPVLFKRFGQNERSLFSFLSADEPFALRDWLNKHDFNTRSPAFLRLPELFDYASYTLIGSRLSSYSVRAWTEIEDTIHRLGDAPPIEMDVLKSIGLLGLVGDASSISASKEVLYLALTSPKCSAKQIDCALEHLKERKLITFRRFKNAYRLWEGSDIDISEQLVEAYQSLPSGSVTLPVARDLCPPSPTIARRHSFCTGTLRFFDTVPAPADSLRSNTFPHRDSDGLIIQCLVDNDEEAAAVEMAAQRQTDPSIIVIIGRDNDELSEAARDVLALDWVKKNAPSLAGDRIAKQELSERRLEAETAFRLEWDKMFEPGRPSFRCYWNQTGYTGLSKRAFLSLLSDACDTVFPYAPILKNELINQRILSSAAAAARHNLAEAMISHSDKPGLGITGYPPQRSIYESLLLQSGIHRKSSDDTWGFERPGDNDPGLQKAWDHMIESAISNELKPKPVAQLFSELTNRPYGVADGFAPILLFSCLLANSLTMAIYEDGVFIPELSAAIMERLMRRPEHFSIVAYAVDGERSSVIERFSRGFKVDNGVLPVVKSLYSRIGSLPQYTINTKDLSKEALAVREAIFRAKSPEHLLFIDLPMALGCKPFDPASTGNMNDKRVTDFFNSLNKVLAEFIDCYPQLLRRIRTGITRIFDIDDDDSDWIGKISGCASKLLNSTLDPKLRVLMVRVLDTGLEEDKYLESIGAGIVDQVPSRWSKADENRFWQLVPELARQVEAIESTQSLKSVLEEDEDGYLVAFNDRDGQVTRHIVRFSASKRNEVRQYAQVLLHQQPLPPLDDRILLAALTEAARQLVTKNRKGDRA